MRFLRALSPDPDVWKAGSTAVFFLRRISQLLWSASLGDALAAQTRAVTEATRDHLLLLGTAVETGAQPPSLNNLEQALAKLAATVAAARQEQTADEAQGHRRDKAQYKVDEHAADLVPAFYFALEQLRDSIEELAECVAVMSKATDRS
jgi:hypothetical protein